MNDLYGKLCPYCKTELKQGDDIIVCSECNMPHHKDCWIENKGCTTFGCLGTIDTPKETSLNDFELTLDDFDMVRCKQCGNLTQKSERYCVYCGNSLEQPIEATQTKSEWIEWNWCAFAFSHYWLMYRKAYLYGIILYIMNVTMLIISIPLFAFGTFLEHIIVGAVGNHLLSRSFVGNNHNSQNISTNITAAICAVVIFGMIVIGKMQ